jgi:hypothetical protein
MSQETRTVSKGERTGTGALIVAGVAGMSVI